MESLTLAEIKKMCKNPKDLRKSQAMNIGISPSESLESAERSWNSLPIQHKNPWIGCYAGYLLNRKNKMTKENLEYFVGYPTMPEWFPEIVEDFNNSFDNIKVEILKSKDAYLTFRRTTYRDYNYSTHKETTLKTLEMGVNETSGKKKVIVPLVKFSYNKDYCDYARFYFQYNISIFFRMLSYNEGFTNPFHKTRRKNKVQYVVDVNNNNKGYRSFSEKKMTLKEVKLLDDIEKVNKFCELLDNSGITPKQTDFIVGLSGRISELKGNKLKSVLRNPNPVKRPRKTLKSTPEEKYPVVPYCRCDQCRKNRLAKKSARFGGWK